jgi:cytoskeletal protein RodZ
MLNKFAEELKAARTERNLTLQQIAAKTRIDLKFLEEMEKGNFSFLPELYINAFLKEYVRLVGLDENLMLKKFAAAKSGKEFYEHEEISEDSSLKKQKNEKDMQKERKVSFSAVDATDFQEFQERTAAQKQKMIIGIAAAVILIFIIV